MNPYLVSQYRELHSQRKDYGSSALLAPLIAEIVQTYAHSSVLDFGCGKGALVSTLQEQWRGTERRLVGYDPAVDQFASAPTGVFDLVVANDVLEHLDPAGYEEDLRSISSFASRSIFVNICCRPAVHVLPDGQNCHTLLMSRRRWIKTLRNIWSEFELCERFYSWEAKNLMLLFVRKGGSFSSTDFPQAAAPKLIRPAVIAWRNRFRSSGGDGK